MFFGANHRKITTRMVLSGLETKMTETSLPTIPEILMLNPHELANDTEKLVKVLTAAQNHLNFLAEELEAVTQSANEANEAKKSPNLIDELVYTYAVSYINSEEIGKRIEATVDDYIRNYLEEVDYSDMADDAIRRAVDATDFDDIVSDALENFSIEDQVISLAKDVIADLSVDIRIR